MEAHDVKKGVYRHYKGIHYCVLDVVRHSETLELMVLYKSLYDTPDYPYGTLWVRPLTMFVEEVDIDGKTEPRFRYIPDEQHDDCKV